MKLNRRRALATVAATGVASGALAFGGVTLAEASSAQPAAATAAVAAAPAATATATPTPTGSECLGGPPSRPGPGGRPGPGLRPGPPGAPQQVMKAAAAYLGLSQDQLRAQLTAGKSLAEVAAARGKAVSGLKNAILAAGTSQVNASTVLTAAQKAALVSWLKDNLDTIVNATLPAGLGWPGLGWPGPGPGWTQGM
jgi:hypothetical protein